MSETVKNAPVYYTKNFDDYNSTQDNFVANQELTVTITLNEYRNLIHDEATRSDAISKANNKYFKAISEKQALEKENSELKAKLIELGFKPQFSASNEEEEE